MKTLEDVIREGSQRGIVGPGVAHLDFKRAAAWLTEQGVRIKSPLMVEVLARRLYGSFYEDLSGTAKIDVDAGLQPAPSSRSYAFAQAEAHLKVLFDILPEEEPTEEKQGFLDGEWRIVGKNDLMSPPTTQWFADNRKQSCGPFSTKAQASAACDALNGWRQPEVRDRGSVLDLFFRDIENELEVAVAKYPTGTVLFRLAALQGEAGELAEGYLKQEPPHQLYKEAVQVGAMVFRVTEALADEQHTKTGDSDG